MNRSKTPNLNKLLEELESFCYTTAIATQVGYDGGQFVVNLRRKGQRVIYGHEPGTREAFMLSILKGGSLLLRSFTAEKDPENKLPVKEIRGYVIVVAEQDITYQKLLPDDMFWASTTDARTGERISMEKAVRYC